MNQPDIELHFSASYREARNKLLTLITAQDEHAWEHTQYAHPEAGLDGEPIYLDTFYRGPKDAQKVLVITSATHGVEGFCGSALQHAWVSAGHTLPRDTAVLLIHAANPYGFEHLRRVTHENVDLNRNFIDFDQGLPANEKYALLNKLLNPESMPPGKMESITAELQSVQASMDYLTFLKAVSGGQYTTPSGIQFGGQSPTWSRQTLEAIWARELASARLVVHIDLHTGLGPAGVGILMMAANEDEPHKAITAEWFGQMMVNERPKRAEDTVLGGYLNAGMEQSLSNAWVMPMTLEFGTKPGDVVLASMIEDNWLRHYGDVKSSQGQEIKRRILRAFYPNSSEWRHAVLTRGKQVFDQALAGIGALAIHKHSPDSPITS